MPTWTWYPSHTCLGNTGAPWAIAYIWPRCHDLTKTWSLSDLQASMFKLLYKIKLTP